jgi:hypothetical protein
MGVNYPIHDVLEMVIPPELDASRNKDGASRANDKCGLDSEELR